MASDPASFRADKIDSQGKRYALIGVVDENADLSFFAGLRGKVELNLKGIRRINSFGVRAWIQEMKRIPPDCTVDLVECPPAVIDQINMIPGFTSRASVMSFLAPMMCNACEREQNHLFLAIDCRRKGGRLPPAVCTTCGAPLELLELEQQYLLFLRL